MAKRKKEKDEEIGGQLSSVPNEKYAKFFGLFPQIETLEVDKWLPAHLLGYFCKKYKETYNEDYTWKFNNENPRKSFEVWQLNTLVARLSKNPQIIKDYIDWAYANLVPKAKRRFTSISFITKDDVVINYKMNVLLAGKKNLNVDRSTPLPDKFKQPFQDIGISISNYGDLAFMSQMEQSAEMQNAFAKIAELGFDMTILERIV